MDAAHAASLRRAAAEAAEAVGEDHTSAAWRAQRKHMFVLTNAGALPGLGSVIYSFWRQLARSTPSAAWRAAQAHVRADQLSGALSGSSWLDGAVPCPGPDMGMCALAHAACRGCA